MAFFEDNENPWLSVLSEVFKENKNVILPNQIPTYFNRTSLVKCSKCNALFINKYFQRHYKIHHQDERNDKLLNFKYPYNALEAYDVICQNRKNKIKLRQRNGNDSVSKRGTEKAKKLKSDNIETSIRNNNELSIKACDPKKKPVDQSKNSPKSVIKRAPPTKPKEIQNKKIKIMTEEPSVKQKISIDLPVLTESDLTNILSDSSVNVVSDIKINSENSLEKFIESNVSIENLLKCTPNDNYDNIPTNILHNNHSRLRSVGIDEMNGCTIFTDEFNNSIIIDNDKDESEDIDCYESSVSNDSAYYSLPNNYPTSANNSNKNNVINSINKTVKKLPDNHNHDTELIPNTFIYSSSSSDLLEKTCMLSSQQSMKPIDTFQTNENFSANMNISSDTNINPHSKTANIRHRFYISGHGGTKDVMKRLASTHNIHFSQNLPEDILNSDHNCSLDDVTKNVNSINEQNRNNINDFNAANIKSNNKVNKNKKIKSNFDLKPKDKSGNIRMSNKNKQKFTNEPEDTTDYSTFVSNVIQNTVKTYLANNNGPVKKTRRPRLNRQMQSIFHSHLCSPDSPTQPQLSSPLLDSHDLFNCQLINSKRFNQILLPNNLLWSSFSSDENNCTPKTNQVPVISVYNCPVSINWSLAQSPINSSFSQYPTTNVNAPILTPQHIYTNKQPNTLAMKDVHKSTSFTVDESKPQAPENPLLSSYTLDVISSSSSLCSVSTDFNTSNLTQTRGIQLSQNPTLMTNKPISTKLENSSQLNSVFLQPNKSNQTSNNLELFNGYKNHIAGNKINKNAVIKIKNYKNRIITTNTEICRRLDKNQMSFQQRLLECGIISKDDIVRSQKLVNCGSIANESSDINSAQSLVNDTINSLNASNNEQSNSSCLNKTCNIPNKPVKVGKKNAVIRTNHGLSNESNVSVDGLKLNSNFNKIQSVKPPPMSLSKVVKNKKYIISKPQNNQPIPNNWSLNPDLTFNSQQQTINYDSSRISNINPINRHYPIIPSTPFSKPTQPFINVSAIGNTNPKRISNGIVANSMVNTSSNLCYPYPSLASSSSSKSTLSCNSLMFEDGNNQYHMLPQSNMVTDGMTVNQLSLNPLNSATLNHKQMLTNQQKQYNIAQSSVIYQNCKIKPNKKQSIYQISNYIPPSTSTVASQQLTNDNKIKLLPKDSISKIQTFDNRNQSF